MMECRIEATAREWMRLEPHQRQKIKEAIAERTSPNTITYFDKIEELVGDLYLNIYGKEA